MTSKKDIEAKQGEEEALFALHRGKDRDETAMEALTTPITQALDTTWQDAAGKTHLKGAPTLIKTATGEDVAKFGFAPSRVCGTCKYFNVDQGRKEIVRQGFFTKLVQDYGWQKKFLGVDATHLAVCGASGGEVCVTSISNAGSCDQYRESASFARKRRGG
jgi:hypothetical protein